MSEKNKQWLETSISRRGLLKSGSMAMGGVIATSMFPGSVLAADGSPLGNYPVGIAKDSCFLGLGCETTGPYSAQGTDMLKGFQLAIEHLNKGNELMRAISPDSKKGILGKRVEYGNVDTASKPNLAIQGMTRFINQDKAIMTAGSVSSAVAIACEKLAQREKVIYLAGISGSNDTTGADCQRYGFRSCVFGYSAAKAMRPVLEKEVGKNKKVAYLVPDYTYGHTVFNSMKEFTGQMGWSVATEQLSPLGTSDFSSYLLNAAASGADVFVNICFGADAVNSIKQAKNFGILDKMTMVIPYMTPFLAKEVGAEIMQDIYCVTDFWWTQGEQNELAHSFVTQFDDKFGYKPEWGAEAAYLQTAMYAEACERAGTFRPEEVIKAYEAGKELDTMLGKVHMRGSDHQLVHDVPIIRGKKPGDMRSEDDYFEVVSLTPGDDVMPPPDLLGCKLGSYT